MEKDVTKRKTNRMQGWLYNGLALIGAATGFISFVWLLIDRCYGKPLYVHIRELDKSAMPREYRGYVPLEITFHNLNYFALVLTEVALMGIDRGELNIEIPSPFIHGKYLLKSKIQNRVTEPAYITIVPDVINGGKPTKTGTPEFNAIYYVSRDVLWNCNHLLDFRFTYHNTNRRRRNRVVKVRGVLIEGRKQPKD